MKILHHNFCFPGQFIIIFFKKLNASQYIYIYIYNHHITNPRWFKDGTQLEKSKKYEIDSDTQTGVLLLVIKKAEDTDVGQYECEVTSTNIHTLISI